MNNLLWEATYIAEHIHAERIAEAEQYRMLKAQAPSHINSSRLAKWMIAFGAAIESIGCRLQSKYQRILRQQESAALGARMIILGESASHRNC